MNRRLRPHQAGVPMSMVLEHSRHLEAFLTPDAIRKPSSWAAEEASARPAKGRPPALRAHAMDGELVSECWKARALPITHAPARLVQHVLPCRCHGGTDRPSGRCQARNRRAHQVKSSQVTKAKEPGVWREHSPGVGKGTCSLCTLSVRSCSQPPTPFRLCP